MPGPTCRGGPEDVAAGKQVIASEVLFGG